MSRDLFSVLNTIDSHLAVYWEESVISKIEIINKLKLWRLFIRVRKLVPSRIIEQSAAQLLDNWIFLNDLEIIQSVLEDSKEINILSQKCRDEISSSFFLENKNELEWNIKSDRVDLITGKNSIYQYILDHQICDSISKWFWHEYRIQILVRALLNDNNAKMTKKAGDYKIIRKPLDFLDLMSIPDAEPEKNHSKKTANKRTKKKQAKTAVELEDLAEGMTSIVVEGEIWEKETTVIKDGRHLVCYYLTDYTDTIMAKKFMKSEEEDGINIGDWVKITGSVRYDTYAKELVLYIDSYVIGKNEKRLDTSESKRIELHAHTKMSAMDGLTNVKELIKRAAEWKHPAIAITDHGGVQAFPDAYHASKEYGIKVIYGLEGYLIETDKKEKPFHIVLLAQNITGLKNLYHIISKSYLDNFYRRPKIPREILEKHREGILLGTACQAGELYQAILNGKEDKEIQNIAAFYDYLEIQPICNNNFLIRENRVKNAEHLQAINKYIVNLGKQINKPVVATGDLHLLDPKDEIFRTILQSGQGYEDTEEESGLYFKSTDEMLQEFLYLGDEDAKNVVIKYPNDINELIEDIKPVPDGFYPPVIDTAEEEITRLTWNKAHELYGELLPEIVDKRIKHELYSITKHGFSVLYLIAHKLVKKSNEDGYLVGSRGSVGSSFVAYLTDITEVNSLQPHLRCPECRYSNFDVDKTMECGVDLPNENCPVCGSELQKCGFNIPFETFLGFEGDKVPDIDLNFSGDYQIQAHHYVEELFGSENVFRAGTISTIAEKTAYGFVKKYMEANQLNIKNSEIKRLAKGITGIRRTTGQHPGGLVVVPKGHDIHEFTPLQHPADKKDSGVITTHFEYHAIGDQLVKLDILGHDDPTVIRELEQLTGVNVFDIHLDDPEIMKLFSGVEVLGIKEEDINSPVGTFGIPEFGTRFVRQMLETTRPTTFSELIRISGLSHGTDVWLNNAQELIQADVADLKQVICTRDDIMTYLIDKEVEKKQSFTIMERVRKGKGLTEEDIKVMAECQVPEWYTDSCQKIKYMFPRAHAVAYVTMAFRIAYFKVNYPLAFYASFFSIRAEDFDAAVILDGYDSIRKRIKEIDGLGNSAPQKDKKMITILELAMELYARGFVFYPVDIYNSDARKYKLYKDGLLLPFSALPNVGESAAQGIVDARGGKPFVSIEEFQVRSHLNKTAMGIMRQYNCFKGLPETTQISLFG